MPETNQVEKRRSVQHEMHSSWDNRTYFYLRAWMGKAVSAKATASLAPRQETPWLGTPNRCWIVPRPPSFMQFWVLSVILTSILKHSQFLAAFISKTLMNFAKNQTPLTSISLLTPKTSNPTMLDACEEVKLHSSTKSDVPPSVPLQEKGCQAKMGSRHHLPDTLGRRSKEGGKWN